MKHKSLISNFFSLSLIQVTNLLVPIVILPYLIHIIGIDRIGLVLLSQALMNQLISIADFGFNINTTREVSQFRNEIQIVSDRITKTIYTKIFLLIFCFLILFVIVTCIPKFNSTQLVFYYSFPIVIGNAFLPAWYFQGIEKMKYLTLINLFGKVLFIVSVFLLIRNQQDYLHVNLFYGFSTLLSSFIALWVMKKKFGIKYRLYSKFKLGNELKAGWYAFLSTFSSITYINSNVIILGFFANSFVVGYYGICEKIILVLRQLLIVFFQSTYPQICQKILISHYEILRYYNRIFFPFLIFVTFSSFLLFGASFIIPDYFQGDDISQASYLMRFFSFVPIIVCLSIPAHQTLLAYNFRKSFMSIFIVGLIVNIILNLWWANIWGAIGTVFSVILTELLITIGLNFILEKKHPNQSIIKAIKMA